MDTPYSKLLGAVVGLSEKHERAPPLVLAVSKTKSVDDVRAVYDQGQRDFGENFVHEIVAKAQALPSDVKWRMIGHLQSNKCKQLLQVRNLDTVETLDSAKLASKLDSCCEQLGRTLNVLVQVNVSVESTKSGAPPSSVWELVSFVATKCRHLRFKGLMTIGHPEEAAAGFRTMAELRRVCLEAGKEIASFPKADEFTLSMGMTADLESALIHGSTEVRIGTAIFGPRVRMSQRDTIGPVEG